MLSDDELRAIREWLTFRIEFWDSIKMQYPKDVRYTQALLAEVDRLKAEKERLKAALKAVEMDADGNCPWCYRWVETQGHNPNCPRQKALGE